MVGAARRRALIGGVIGVSWLAALFVVSPIVGGFGPISLSQWIVQRTPGSLTSTAINLLGHAAKPTLVIATSVTLVLVCSVLRAIWPLVPYASPALAIWLGSLATLVSIGSAGASLAPVTFTATAIAVAFPLLVNAFISGGNHAPDGRSPSEGTRRRRFANRFGLTILSIPLFVAVGRNLANLFGRTEPVDTPGNRVEEHGPNEPLPFSVDPPDGDTRFDFAGMPSAVTSPEEHYVVDKNIEIGPASQKPEIEVGSWTLTVDGAVARPYTLSFDDLLSHEHRVEQTVTLVCISNPVGGRSIGTAHWTGIPLAALVDSAMPRETALDVVTHAADGYSEAIPLELLERGDILLAFGMGNRTLRTEHGFPLRLVLPGRYGMKMTKWITRIQVVERDHESYYEARGWSEAGVINPLAYIRSIRRHNAVITIGGVAFAGRLTGTPAISHVEVSIDGGETWRTAELERSLDGHAWRRWRYEFEAPDRRTVHAVARTVLRDGTVQTSERSAPRPNGATGWHEVTETV